MLCHKLSIPHRLAASRQLWQACVLALGLTASLASIASVQPTPGDRSRTQTPRVHRKSNIDNQVDRLTKRLELTPQQQGSVRRILEHHREQIAQVWDDANIEPIARTYKLRDLQDETVKQIRLVLNDDQRQKYMTVPEHKNANSSTLESNYNKYVSAH